MLLIRILLRTDSPRLSSGRERHEHAESRAGAKTTISTNGAPPATQTLPLDVDVPKVCPSETLCVFQGPVRNTEHVSRAIALKNTLYEIMSTFPSVATGT